MKGYVAKIMFSSRELSAKEKIMLKDTSDAVKLDEAVAGGAILIKPILSAEISIHNEKADNKDYSVYVIVANDGVKYVTSSESFWTTYTDIESEMSEETDEWEIKVYHKPSKNYAGRNFITCSIV